MELTNDIMYNAIIEKDTSFEEGTEKVFFRIN
jgi:hypothetical protein